MTKIKPPKAWRATVNLDRLDATTGHWRITTGSGSDPLPRVVATDPAVWASIVAWMTAHRAKHKPSPDESELLSQAIRTSVTTAFRALPPSTEPKAPAVAAKKSAASERRVLA